MLDEGNSLDAGAEKFDAELAVESSEAEFFTVINGATIDTSLPRTGDPLPISHGEYHNAQVFISH